MPRFVKVAAAQMGPNNEGTSREEIVERMLALLEQAVVEDVELIAYPEMALTTYFPKRIRDDFDQFFETEVPPKALLPRCSQRANEARIACHVGFSEKADGRYFNTALLTDETGRLAGTFRKIHLPGVTAARRLRAGVRAPLLRDRRYAASRCSTPPRRRSASPSARTGAIRESYRCLGLLGAEIVLIGYNTPLSPLALDLNELCLRAGAYQNSLFVVGIAKAGVEDGMELIGGSCIVSPLGQVLAKAATTGDELIAARIDLDHMVPARKRWDFLGRRHPEHYGLVTEPVRRRS